MAELLAIQHPNVEVVSGPRILLGCWNAIDGARKGLRMMSLVEQIFARVAD